MIKTSVLCPYPSVRNIVLAVLSIQARLIEDGGEVGGGVIKEFVDLRDWFRPYVCKTLSLPIGSNWEAVGAEIGLLQGSQAFDQDEFMRRFKICSGVCIEEEEAGDKYARLEYLAEQLVGKM